MSENLLGTGVGLRSCTGVSADRRLWIGVLAMRGLLSNGDSGFGGGFVVLKIKHIIEQYCCLVQSHLCSMLLLRVEQKYNRNNRNLKIQGQRQQGKRHLKKEFMFFQSSL